jgi:sphingomyelin phosphodiesterase 2
MKISLLTYNLSLLPIFNFNRKNKIFQFVNSTINYDIIVIQEIAHKDDIELITNLAFENNFIYSHYFMHGCGFPLWESVAGTGILVLSKFKIMQSIYKQYSLNGRPYKFFHADYFGAKGVGLLYILINNKILQLYVTHLHANYVDNIKSVKNNLQDEYRHHRISQIFELSQFIKITQTNNYMILCGDLNSDESINNYNLSSYGCSLISEITNMIDSLENSQLFTFGEKYHIKQRLDYIMSKNIKLISSNITDIKYNYQNKINSISDHFGVEAIFLIKDNLESNLNKLNNNLDNNLDNKLENNLNNYKILNQVMIDIEIGIEKEYILYNTYFINSFYYIIMFFIIDYTICRFILLFLSIISFILLHYHFMYNIRALLEIRQEISLMIN